MPFFLGTGGWSESPPLIKGDLGGFTVAWINFNGGNLFPRATENRKPKTENCLSHLSLPATAWPRPQAVQGTPAVPRPGLGPHGCGWALVSLGLVDWQFKSNIWQA
jgi:hypothetical protein